MKKIATVLLVMGIFSLMSFTGNNQEPEKWDVPEKYIQMENPVTADKESIKLGEMLYKRHCASCHGRIGLGDGPKSRMLDTYAGDFSGDFYQNQTDGEHFYKTLVGRNEMPGYKGKVLDEDIWHMVNYMRTFKK